MKLYKLTTQDYKTRKGKQNECTWGEGVTHSGTGVGPLCSPGWIHAYTSPLLAVLLNPIHANLDDPILWEAEGDIGLSDSGLKVGGRSLTTIKKIPLPILTREQKVIFAILCAKSVYKNPSYLRWADNYISGKDRTYAAANAAAKVAYYEADDAAATYATFAAEDAANAAKHADYACTAADAASAAKHAAYAYAAADADFDINFLAEQALTMK